LSEIVAALVRRMLGVTNYPLEVSDCFQFGQRFAGAFAVADFKDDVRSLLVSSVAPGGKMHALYGRQDARRYRQLRDALPWTSRINLKTDWHFACCLNFIITLPR